MRTLFSLVLLAVPVVASAQLDLSTYHGPVETEASSSHRFSISGYAEAETPSAILDFSFVPGETDATQSSYVAYSTNFGTDHTVLAHVEGDFDGLQLQIAPDGLPDVEQVAQNGSAGSTSTVTFDASGSKPFITGVRQVVARQAIVYRLMASAGAPPAGATFTVEFTVVP